MKSSTLESARRLVLRAIAVSSLLAVAAVATGCDDGGGGEAGGDCRLAGQACAAGFRCVEEAPERWVCRPEADGGGGDVDGSRGEPDAAGGLDAWAPHSDAAPDLGAPDARPDDGVFDADLPDVAADGAPPADGAPDAFVPDAAADAGVPDAAADAGMPDAAPPAPAAAACEVDEDCASGRCAEDLPGGFCLRDCDLDDCEPDQICGPLAEAGAVCFDDCERDEDCRPDYVCDGGACRPGCAAIGCPDGLACGDDGRCRPDCVPADEVCDGVDDDCDGRIDDGAPCPEGRVCQEGRCVRELYEAAGPCAGDADCARGACISEAESEGLIPGGICIVDCDDDADCPDGTGCFLAGDRPICFALCDDDRPCREGWTCAEVAGGGACVTDCRVVGCDPGTVCDEASGVCEPETAEEVVVRLEQVILAPGQSDGSTWDGVGQVSPELLAELAEALGTPTPLPEVLGLLGSDLVAQLERPDPSGIARLFVNDAARPEVELPERNDTFTPEWDAAWADVPLGPDDRVTLELVLEDEDVVADDFIGRPQVDTAAIRAALSANGPLAIRVDEQTDGQVLFIVIDVAAP